jgi:hypothetical protein
MSEYLVDYKIITIYPIFIYLGYILCKKYYKYMLNCNLLVLDMYDNTYDNNNININDNNNNNKQTQTESYLIAFNEIPT